jgi:Protein of unknown function (DUF5818)
MIRYFRILPMVLIATLSAAGAAAAADSLLERARGAVQDAAQSIEQAAKNAGRSVKDFLGDHPDLNRDLIDFGKRVGVPGFADEAPKPPVAVSVTGTLSKEGVECPALRGDDGKLYTLTPAGLGTFGPGDRVHVEGKVAEVSLCMQGTTIAVTAITAAK